MGPSQFPQGYQRNITGRHDVKEHGGSPQLLRTPVSFTTSDDRAYSNSESNTPEAIVNAHLATHKYYKTPNANEALAPVDKTHQLISSPAGALGLGISTGLTGTPSQHPYLQTPPASAPGGARSFVPNRQVNMAGERRMSASRLMGPPATPGRLTGASPQLFPSLQFSPDLFQPHLSGPASAPVLPQQRLFWDPSNSSIAEDDENTMYQDPFNTFQQGLVSPFLGSIAQPEVFVNPSPVFSNDGFSQSSQTVLPSQHSPYLESAAFPTPFTASPRPAPQIAENPSLFLSSPARRFEPMQNSINSERKASQSEGQPYQHQIRESKRLENSTVDRKLKTIVPNPTSAIFHVARQLSTSADPRLGLQRSLTHSGVSTYRAHVHQPGQVSFSESVSVSNGLSRKLSRGGRSSPLKRSSAYLDDDFLERPRSRNRTSLSLTIDPDGRARTIATKLPDPTTSFMDLDDDFSSDSESADETNIQIVQSRNTSFVAPPFQQQQDPLNRIKNQSRSHSKTSSYSSTVDSVASHHQSSRTSSLLNGSRPKSQTLDHSQRRVSQSTRPPPSHRFSQQLQSQQSFVAEEGDSSDEDDGGNAQFALRAMRKDRMKSRSANSGHHFDNNQFHSSPPVHDYSYRVNTNSPTTITDPGANTPSTDRESYASSASTRCVCKHPSPDGRDMIQW